MMRVFKITGEVTKVAVSVVATDSDEAAGIFGSWIEHRQPELGPVSFDTVIVSLTEMALQPQLQEVAAKGAGILYWLGHRAGWVAAGPQ